MDAHQQSLDFSSALNERLALVRGLRNVPHDLSRGRVDGVVELLERLLVLSRSVGDGQRVEVVAQVTGLAAKISSRRTVQERTVQRWTADAKELAYLTVEYTSHRRGGREWNRYVIHLGAIRAVVVPGSVGVTRGDTGRHDVGPRGRHDVGPRGRHDVGPSYVEKCNVTTSSQDADIVFATWEEVEEQVAALRPEKASVQVIVRRAKRNGLSADHALQLIEHFRSQAREGDRGLLFWRLMNDGPRDDPAARWDTRKEVQVRSVATLDATAAREIRRSKLIMEARRAGNTLSEEQVQALLEAGS